MSDDKQYVQHPKKSWVLIPKKFSRLWWNIRLKRLAYVGVGLMLGIVGMYFSSARIEFNRIYSIESGYLDNWHEFHAYSCERTKANGDAYPDGVQAFVLHTGPSIAALAKHVALVDGLEETASPEWHKPLVVIDYNKNHEVCVKHMWERTDTCFDLYELGER